MGKSSTDILYDFFKGLSPVFDAIELTTSIKNEIGTPVSNGNNAGSRSVESLLKYPLYEAVCKKCNGSVRWRGNANDIPYCCPTCNKQFKSGSYTLTQIKTDDRPTDPTERIRQRMNAQSFVHGKCKKCLQEVTFKWFIHPGIFRRGSPTPNICPHCKKWLEPIEYAYVDKER